MSDPTENNTVSTGDTAAAGNALFYSVVVKCPRPVYRRAGYALVRGKNTLAEVPRGRLDILRQDPVLSVVSETPVSPEDVPGRMDILDVGGVSDSHGKTADSQTPETPLALISPAVSLSSRIRDAVSRLDKTNPEHFTKNGVPRVAAVSEAVGETITAAQLQAAQAEGTDA